MSIQVILNAATANGSGAALRTAPTGPIPADHCYQATIVGTGAVSASVTIEGSNDGANFVALGSALSLTGTTTDTKGAAYVGPWQCVRATVASISGTGAAVTVVQGIA